MRVGHGYDVHRLVESRKLILGGVEIPWEKGLLGHSDADVLTHALMDALLGAAALGDIGHLFPDKDPAYEGADSIELLKAMMERLDEAGWKLGNHRGEAGLHRRGSGHRGPRGGADRRKVKRQIEGSAHRMEYVCAQSFLRAVIS